MEQPGVLSPASDGMMLFISRNRDALAEKFRFLLPSDRVVEAAVDKRKLYDMTAAHGLLHADTFYPESMDDIHAIKHDVRYPAFIKPYFSHLWEEKFPGGKGFKVHNAAELVDRFEMIFPTGVEAMVQSIIEGPATNVRTVYMYVNREGEFLGHLTTRKLRQFPVEFGRGSLAETHWEPEIAEMGKKFFTDIGFRSFGTVEFKRDDRDGQWKLTDLNPRWVGPQQLPTAAGVDFPIMHYRDLTEKDVEPQFEFQQGVRWLNGVNDLASSWWHFRHGLLDPLGWIRSYRGVGSHASFASDDIGPFLKEYGYGKKFFKVPINMIRQRD